MPSLAPRRIVELTPIPEGIKVLEIAPVGEVVTPKEKLSYCSCCMSSKYESQMVKSTTRGGKRKCKSCTEKAKARVGNNPKNILGYSPERYANLGSFLSQRI